MTHSSPASAVTAQPRGAALTEEMGFTVDMKMRAFISRIVRATRASGQLVKAGASYALEVPGRAGVAGSEQAGQSKSEV